MAGLSGPVLVLNAGSSSLKASLIADRGAITLAAEEIDWGVEPSGAADRATALEQLVAGITAGHATPGAVGYRVVHGGERFVDPVLLTDAVLAALEDLEQLAPLHNHVAIETIRVTRRLLPGLSHVASFDTAFHATLPEVARRYPLPAEWVARWGLRRFGFHGLSVEWSVGEAGRRLGRSPGDLQLVVAHLGSGCSATAVDGGRSVATSMGYTPLEGLMMGTRSGSVDPGLLLHLLRADVTVDALSDGLEHHSGLLGMSGRTSSVRSLEALAAAGDSDAALALEVFSARAAAGIAGVATALSRVDAVVFTGGIGANSEFVRDAVTRRLAVLSLGGDPDRVLAVAAREDLVIALHVERLLTAA